MTPCEDMARIKYSVVKRISEKSKVLLLTEVQSRLKDVGLTWEIVK